MKALEELMNDMGGVDLVIINSGIGYINLSLEWGKEIETIDVNVIGFSAMANVAMRHFLEKNVDILSRFLPFRLSGEVKGLRHIVLPRLLCPTIWKG